MDGGDRREPPDSSAQSKSPRTLRNFMHGNRETSGVSEPVTAADRREKAESRTARMHAPEESDRGVVPENRSNKGRPLDPAEGEEGRPRIKENASPTHTQPAQSGERVSQGLAGVRQAARRRKQEKFTDAAPSPDGGTVARQLLRNETGGGDGSRWSDLEGV